jgi:hypothetical protein
MSLVKSYLSVLEEKDGSGIVSGTEKLVGDLPGKTKEHMSANKVEGVEAPVDGPHSQQDPEAELKEVKGESTNPFDALYNKVVEEENWNYETEAEEPFKNETSGPEEVDFDFQVGADDANDDMPPEGLEAVLSHLKSAVEALENLVSSEKEGEKEGEEEDMEEEGMDMVDEEEYDYEDDNETLPEAVEAEIEGHALVDQEKLSKGMNKPSSFAVKGAVPVAKGKSQVPKGAKVNGKPQPFTTKPETLTTKQNNVGGVKVGKALFDQ